MFSLTLVSPFRWYDPFSTSIRDIEPLFSSTAVVAVTGENLFANLRAFGDKRSRKVRGIIGALVVLGGNSVHRASDVILWITRTPSLTIVRRCNLSSSWSASRIKSKMFNIYFYVWVCAVWLHRRLVVRVKRTYYPYECEHHNWYQWELHCTF